MTDQPITYASAGVDVHAGDRAVELMKDSVRRATRPEVLGGLGGFAGMFDASALKGMQHPVLASSTDGVGTKVAIAQAMDVHDTIGQDLVGMVVDDIDRAVASLQAIRALGVTVALDDFGTGFSSLTHLARLPIDTLKIDRSFIEGLDDSPEGLAVVAMIITLAHSLRHKVVAEGVETAEQARLLRSLGCDEMQGFHFSLAVPADVFASRHLPGSGQGGAGASRQRARPGSRSPSTTTRRARASVITATPPSTRPAPSSCPCCSEFSTPWSEAS